MKTTRRKFIQHLGSAAIAVITLSSAGSVLGQTINSDGLFHIPDISTDPVSRLTSAHFSPFIDTFVRVYTNEKRSVRLKIAGVKELRRETNERRGYQGECFSVLFEDSRPFRLPQDVYRIEHLALGEISLLLVPVGIDGNIYEIVINRISR